ncbi:hypothetical protein [Alienimonas californiensis]|uniref:Uncharacterized protein n=1 Tax=Alienimonas californiensis TaxID=2527989 RepID=A0A517PB61_9PLAN|nr:hypothetical protein [Alienimonas californiensis]QDT16625.1 hypothetical protein CA12_27310 [Alienimonas californiensis]
MDKPVLLNNCKGRPHATLFGPKAFYDLNTHGVQTRKATDLRVGRVCIVAQKPDDQDMVQLDRYSFEFERLMADPEFGDDVRVMFGELLDSETLPKDKAASRSLYSALFNVNGDFKQVAVVEN